MEIKSIKGRQDLPATSALIQLKCKMKCQIREGISPPRRDSRSHLRRQWSHRNLGATWGSYRAERLASFGQLFFHTAPQRNFIRSNFNNYSHEICVWTVPGTMRVGVAPSLARDACKWEAYGPDPKPEPVPLPGNPKALFEDLKFRGELAKGAARNEAKVLLRINPQLCTVYVTIKNFLSGS